MVNYIELLRKSANSYLKNNKESNIEYCNKLLLETYDDLVMSVEDEDLKRINNLFVLVCGFSLDTIINSENAEELVEKGYVELTSPIK